MKDSAEKARLYDLIIDRAKKELDDCGSQNCDTANMIFKLIPELNIDEGEKIRKALISVLKSDFEKDTTIEGISVGDIITYLEKNGAKRPLRKPDYEGLTEFEKALANACVGWMGKKPNWQHYIKDSADILLRIAKISDSIQDAPFEEKPAWKPTDEQMDELRVAKDSCFDLSFRTKNILKSLYNDLKKLKEEQVTACKVKPLYTIGDFIIPLNDVMCEVVGISVSATNGAIYTLRRTSAISGETFQADANTIDSTATLVRKIQKQ